MSRVSRLFLFVIVAGVMCVLGSSAAHAYDWPRKLNKGDKGKHVQALQVRVAGWFPSWNKRRFGIDGSFGDQTAEAVRRFEKNYGIRNPNGVASGSTFKVLNRLADPDGSTENFDWSEFRQHSNSSCSAQANAYAGTLKGGPVSAARTERNVRRLMWRLEALRKKAGGHAVGINSGFRSIPYNACIGGASASQHLYGTAADNRIAAISNSKARRLARGSQFSGVICYATTTHNHLDIRVENKALSYAQNWWWPRKDSAGRELDDAGRVCWGETSTSVASPSRTLSSVRSAIPGVGSLVPSTEEVQAFAEAGEPDDLLGAD
ncbi:MAG: D-Ala-D-Ala carboxypeptidase family metallohydrolase [Actinomycetota bacterium]|nr:D-Ala-D-Ala carboxypeptidase family metallohydrolase [Actinomycetota bacterium]